MEEVEEPEYNCACPKILIVDDNDFGIYALNIMLENTGYKTASANNGKTAIEQVKERQENCSCMFKLILMDCEMPLMNGYEATTILKK